MAFLWEGGIPWPNTGAKHNHAQLGLPDKGRAITRLVVCNSWDVFAFGPSSPRLLLTVAKVITVLYKSENHLEWTIYFCFLALVHQKTNLSLFVFFNTKGFILCLGSCVYWKYLKKRLTYFISSSSSFKKLLYQKILIYVTIVFFYCWQLHFCRSFNSEWSWTQAFQKIYVIV